MKLADISKDDTVYLTIKGNSKMELPVEIIGVAKDSLLVKGIKVNGRVLSFTCESKISIYLTLVSSDMPPILWHNIAVCNVKVNGDTIHQIRCANDGIEINRRQEFRVFTGINCNVNHDKTRKPIECTIKDISYNGVGIVSKTDLELGNGERIEVAFSDSETRSMFNITGQVVRTTPHNGKYLIGIAVDSSKAYKNYVHQKQLLVVKKNAKKSMRA